MLLIDKLLIACGAGTGLAAVYQVPFASTLFVLETLGISWRLKNLGIILVTTYLSAYCVRPIVGKEAMYQVGKVGSDPASLIQVILYETFEVPGAYLRWAKETVGIISHQPSKVYEEKVLPETVEGIDFLIVMGGPQSPDEDRQAFPYYDPEADIAFMQKAITADIYIVGVCLGAQLLSVAYGGKYEHSAEHEIGVFPITLTDDGLADEHVKGFGTTLNTGHWHGDMPGLTDNAVVLATSQGCQRQIIRFSPKHYAF